MNILNVLFGHCETGYNSKVGSHSVDNSSIPNLPELNMIQSSHPNTFPAAPNRLSLDIAQDPTSIQTWGVTTYDYNNLSETEIPGGIQYPHPVSGAWRNSSQIYPLEEIMSTQTCGIDPQSYHLPLAEWPNAGCISTSNTDIDQLISAIIPRFIPYPDIGDPLVADDQGQPMDFGRLGVDDYEMGMNTNSSNSNIDSPRLLPCCLCLRDMRRIKSCSLYRDR